MAGIMEIWRFTTCGHGLHRSNIYAVHCPDVTLGFIKSHLDHVAPLSTVHVMFFIPFTFVFINMRSYTVCFHC